MITVYNILRRDTLLTGTNRDGHTVLITASDKQYLALFSLR